MIKLVAFDWNGTLLSDASACVYADNISLKLLGIKPLSLKKYREFFRVPIKEFWTVLGASKEAIELHSQEVNRIFHKIYEERVMKCRTRRGTREILAWLQNKRIPAVIFSNHTIKGIESQLNRLKIGNYFSDVVANEHTGIAVNERNKLHRLQNYIESKSIKGSEVVIVGDSCEEIEIGRALGSITVAVTNGYYSASRLREGRPDHLISSMASLKEIISHHFA
jgi:phosphoglycolate phosphatase-like HAD superfamily hydrolase